MFTTLTAPNTTTVSATATTPLSTLLAGDFGANVLSEQRESTKTAETALCGTLPIQNHGEQPQMVVGDFISSGSQSLDNSFLSSASVNPDPIIPMTGDPLNDQSVAAMMILQQPQQPQQPRYQKREQNPALAFSQTQSEFSIVSSSDPLLVPRFNTEFDGRLSNPVASTEVSMLSPLYSESTNSGLLSHPDVMNLSGFGPSLQPQVGSAVDSTQFPLTPIDPTLGNASLYPQPLPSSTENMDGTMAFNIMSAHPQQIQPSSLTRPFHLADSTRGAVGDIIKDSSVDCSAYPVGPVRIVRSNSNFNEEMSPARVPLPALGPSGLHMGLLASPTSDGRDNQLNNLTTTGLETMSNTINGGGSPDSKAALLFSGLPTFVNPNVKGPDKISTQCNIRPSTGRLSHPPSVSNFPPSNAALRFLQPLTPQRSISPSLISTADVFSPSAKFPNVRLNPPHLSPAPSVESDAPFFPTTIPPAWTPPKIKPLIRRSDISRIVNRDYRTCDPTKIEGDSKEFSDLVRNVVISSPTGRNSMMMSKRVRTMRNGGQECETGEDLRSSEVGAVVGKRRDPEFGEYMETDTEGDSADSRAEGLRLYPKPKHPIATTQTPKDPQNVTASASQNVPVTHLKQNLIRRASSTPATNHEARLRRTANSTPRLIRQQSFSSSVGNSVGESSTPTGNITPDMNRKQTSPISVEMADDSKMADAETTSPLDRTRGVSVPLATPRGSSANNSLSSPDSDSDTDLVIAALTELGQKKTPGKAGPQRSFKIHRVKDLPYRRASSLSPSPKPGPVSSSSLDSSTGEQQQPAPFPAIRTYGYLCRLCDKQFVRESNLVAHLRHTHQQSGELNIENTVMGPHIVDRPFKCVECKKSFRRKHDLLRHGNVHSQRQAAVGVP
ncbi:hypothetical protein HK102_003035 [Quaeritorhiza haematococci]|nr:hypothetical protein HK102_003035 [Quaeritorhiza haematococci]